MLRNLFCLYFRLVTFFSVWGTDGDLKMTIDDTSYFPEKMYMRSDCLAKVNVLEELK